MTNLVLNFITIDWYIILTTQHSVPNSKSPHQFYIRLSVAEYTNFRKQQSKHQTVVHWPLPKTAKIWQNHNLCAFCLNTIKDAESKIPGAVKNRVTNNTHSHNYKGWQCAWKNYRPWMSHCHQSSNDECLISNLEKQYITRLLSALVTRQLLTNPAIAESHQKSPTKYHYPTENYRKKTRVSERAGLIG